MTWHPDRALSELQAANPEWAVLFGRYTREFVAFPTWVGYAHRGVVTARRAAELQRVMVSVEAASGRRAAQSRPPVQ